MAREHVLHTQLNIDECKDRLKAKVQMATFFPEMRGKGVVGGVRRNRFWIQGSREANSRCQYGRSVFYGRLIESPDGCTKVIGHYGRSTVGRLGVFFLALVMCILFGALAANILRHQFDPRRLGWIALAIGWAVVWAVIDIRCSQDRHHKILSFLRRVLDAKPVENEKDALVRH